MHPRTIFCSRELAGRIEEAECRLLLGGAASAARRAPEPGVVVERLAGGAAIWAGDGSPLNKVAGLGFDGVPTDEQLETVETAFAARSATVQVELSNLADPEVAALLTGRGYRLVGFENVLGLAIEPESIPDPVAGVEVTVSPDDELGLWLDLVVDGFAHPDTQGVASHEEFPRQVLERVIGDLTTAEGFVRFLARRGGEPAGGGSLRLDAEIAQLTGAATLPAHRRQGVQTALLAKRLETAAEAGCRIAIVTTQPGSKSQQNVQKQGFELLYSRAVLVKDP